MLHTYVSMCFMYLRKYVCVWPLGTSNSMDNFDHWMKSEVANWITQIANFKFKSWSLCAQVVRGRSEDFLSLQVIVWVLHLRSSQLCWNVGLRMIIFEHIISSSCDTCLLGTCFYTQALPFSTKGSSRLAQYTSVCFPIVGIFGLANTYAHWIGLDWIACNPICQLQHTHIVDPTSKS